MTDDTPESQETLFIIAHGNPIDGLNFTGPFDDHDDALRFAESQRWDDGMDWWIVPLQPRG